MIPISIANGFYKSDSLPVSSQVCINFYPVINEKPALSEVSLFGIPGIVQKLTTGSAITDANRGAAKLADVPYVVNGAALYRIESDYTYTSLGTISGSGRVSMANNGTQLFILVPGGTGYIYTISGGLVTISDVDFTANGNPQHVVFIDGYFICSTDTKKFIMSSINDGTAWNALDYGTAEADPDVITAPIVLNNQLYMIGSKTGEAFANTALGADFPFIRTGTFFWKGSTSPFSIINVNSSVIFVGSSEGESPAVWQYAGGAPTKISTTPIDTLLQRLTQDEIADIFAWSYAQNGAYFVGLTLPDTCIVYDLSSGIWHERKSLVTYADGSEEITRYRVNSIVQAYGVLLCGDYQDGRIGSLDIDTYSEYDEHIIRRVSTQPFQNQGNSFFVPRLEIVMESGVGNAVDTDPQISMQRTMDGHTWTDFRDRSIGAVGRYDTRQIWYKNGRAARFEAFAFEMSAKVKAVIVQLFAEIVPGYK